MLEVWSVQRKMRLLVQEELPDFETRQKIPETSQSRVESSRYLETEAFLLQCGSILDGK